ncbi:MAG: hypothetical protein WDA75_10240 [Candidatus Latescibacterota bacterium]|jgi:hypothetical protein
MELEKVIRCPVHGYISVPPQVLADFVDHEIFQRLRWIEQTSMRPLYPSASHNRFVHSLGTYHLARRAFSAIISHTQLGAWGGVAPDDYAKPFEIAALMHDCAHAPFSHTFENLYKANGGAPTAYLLEQTAPLDPSFKDDYEALCAVELPPKVHEELSAAVFLDYFGAAYTNRHGSRETLALVARMITGCVHAVPVSPQQEIENCLIRLINGVIDVDKLDYIMRDSWTSGVNNVSIDHVRLLSSLRLARTSDGMLQPCFNKSALSTIQSVIDGRNYLNYWIHSHHTVVYYQELVTRAAQGALRSLSPPDDPSFLERSVFSRASFARPAVFSGRCLYLTSDADLLHLMKQCLDTVPEAEEYLSRRPTRVPLWKSRAEFALVFRDRGHNSLVTLFGIIPQLLGPCLSAAERANVWHLKVPARLEAIEPHEVFITIGDQVVQYSETMAGPSGKSGDEDFFFYVYIPRTAEAKRQACLDALRKARIGL